MSNHGHQVFSFICLIFCSDVFLGGKELPVFSKLKTGGFICNVFLTICTDIAKRYMEKGR